MSEVGKGLQAFQKLDGVELKFEHRQSLRKVTKQANGIAGIKEESEHIGEQYNISVVLFNLPESHDKDEIARTKKVVSFIIDGKDHIDAQNKGIERAAVLLGLV